MPLDADAVRLAKGRNLATVVTLMPDGQPQALLTWIDSDGENLLVNTEPQRQKSRNIRRDPRVTVLLHSEQDQHAAAAGPALTAAGWAVANHGGPAPAAR
jgi:PPOX class probable F420-dependent enzyme